MKRFFILCFVLGNLALPLCAQLPERPVASGLELEAAGPGDPSALAMRESQRLQQALGLNDKQTRKVYKLFYAHFKAQMPQTGRFGAPRGMGGGPGMGSGMEPVGPGRMVGHPGAPDGIERGGHPQFVGAKDAAKEREAWRQTQEKKFRKIFTETQFAAWKKLETLPAAPHRRASEDPVRPGEGSAE